MSIDAGDPAVTGNKELKKQKKTKINQQKPKCWLGRLKFPDMLCLEGFYISIECFPWSLLGDQRLLMCASNIERIASNCEHMSLVQACGLRALVRGSPGSIPQGHVHGNCHRETKARWSMGHVPALLGHVHGQHVDAGSWAPSLV